VPVRVEHEYGRCGSLNLFGAFDARSRRVYARTSARKRAEDFIAFLEQLERDLPADQTRVQVVLDERRARRETASGDPASSNPVRRTGANRVRVPSNSRAPPT
jgi:hypothetical protein